MPRFEPRKNQDKNFSENYSYSEDNQRYEDNRRLEDALNTTEKAINAITRLFWNENTQKPHISENLIQRLEPIWDREIAPILLREFGRNTNLSVIFYQGKYDDEALMEVWDPRHFNTKPSQIFTLLGVSKNEVRYLARTRKQASVLNLNNWWI
jgi:hypothetical protein